MKTILVTGGAGFIGSHTVVELLAQNYSVIILDNFHNSSPKVIERIQAIAQKSPTLIEGDILDEACLDKLFQDYSIDAVIHFAGLKAVGESVQKPLFYYENNVAGSLCLLKAMQKAGVFNFVFSSSATVYGDPQQLPIPENHPLGNPTNPYGMSKLMVERILQDLSASNPQWSIARLRYFNPIGAHPSGLIGESPNDIPNNLMPYITQVAIGRREALSVFGSDYPTPDGTGVRDYIHVVDLAKGHLAALDYLKQHKGCHTWNLGTGKGYSVLELVKAFERVTQMTIPYQLVERRAGDIASCYSDPQKAMKELAWEAQYNLDDMMAHSWHWQKQNPNGFEDN